MIVRDKHSSLFERGILKEEEEVSNPIYSLQVLRLYNFLQLISIPYRSKLACLSIQSCTP